MKLLEAPKTEAAILAEVSEHANSRMILSGIIAKAEYCVDHLCGCTTGF